jgi:hypothetical protein
MRAVGFSVEARFADKPRNSFQIIKMRAFSSRLQTCLQELMGPPRGFRFEAHRAHRGGLVRVRPQAPSLLGLTQ